MFLQPKMANQLWFRARKAFRSFVLINWTRKADDISECTWRRPVPGNSCKLTQSESYFLLEPELSNNKFSSPNLHVSAWWMRNWNFGIFRVWHFYPNGGKLGIQRKHKGSEFGLKDNIWSEPPSISISALTLFGGVTSDSSGFQRGPQELWVLVTQARDAF